MDLFLQIAAKIGGSTPAAENSLKRPYDGLGGVVLCVFMY